LSSLEFTGYDLSKLRDGTQFAELNNVEICRKYVNEATKNQCSQKSKKKGKAKIKRHFLMFKEHIDTSQFYSNVNKICENMKGGIVTITEKCHGSSQRTSSCKVVYDLPRWKYKFNKNIFPLFQKRELWQYTTGTRRTVITDFSNNSGYYGHHQFRKPYHDKFVGNLKKGETVYYEVVGYSSGETTIMPSCDNKKVKDKEFVKRYGPTTTFKYGCLEGESKIYIYRITMTNEDGDTIEYPWNVMVQRCQELGFPHVPLLTEPFILNHTPSELTQMVEGLHGGPSTIDPSHIREGVVVRIDFQNNFNAYKSKNFYFKVLEGIIKDEGGLDIEEAQDFIESDGSY
jgi:hypothetical protein